MKHEVARTVSFQVLLHIKKDFNFLNVSFLTICLRISLAVVLLHLGVTHLTVYLAAPHELAFAFVRLCDHIGVMAAPAAQHTARMQSVLAFLALSASGAYNALLVVGLAVVRRFVHVE